jgi:hypothetical protein
MHDRFASAQNVERVEKVGTGDRRRASFAPRGAVPVPASRDPSPCGTESHGATMAIEDSHYEQPLAAENAAGKCAMYRTFRTHTAHKPRYTFIHRWARFAR